MKEPSDGEPLMRSVKTGTLTVYKPAGIPEKEYEPLEPLGAVQVRRPDW